MIMTAISNSFWHYQVVLVEDDPVLSKVLAAQLQAAGITFRIAKNGYQTLKLVRRYCPLVLILDLGVAGLNGSEIVETLRTDPSFGDLKDLKLIVYASQDLTESERQRLTLETRTYFYTKTIDDHDIGEIVKQLIGAPSSY